MNRIEMNNTEDSVRKNPVSIKEGISDNLRMNPKPKIITGTINTIASFLLLPNFSNTIGIRQENNPDNKIMVVTCNMVIKTIVGF